MKCSPQTDLYLGTPNTLVLSHLQQRHAYVYATHINLENFQSTLNKEVQNKNSVLLLIQVCYTSNDLLTVTFSINQKIEVYLNATKKFCK